MFYIEDVCENKLLTIEYTKGEYSFESIPRYSADISLLIDYLELCFDSNTKRLRRICGMCAHTAWIDKKLTPPLCSYGSLMLKKDIKSGDVIRISENQNVYYDKNSGWVCIGEYDSEKSRSVGVSQSIIVSLEDNNISAVWLRPEFVDGGRICV